MEWISVKDKLPEIIEDGYSEEVLCVGHKGTHPNEDGFVRYEIMSWKKLSESEQVLTMKKIKATFTGKDGSLGFRNGVDYQLTVSTGKTIEIRGTGKAGQVVCIYGSLISFLDNWDNIQTIPLHINEHS